MGAIFSGILVGAFAAGYVALHHGALVEQGLAQLRDPLVSAVGLATAPAAEPATTGSVVTVVANTASSTPTSVSAAPATTAGHTAAVAVTKGEAPTQEARWTAFAAAPPLPAGNMEFPWRQCFRRAAASHALPEALLLAVASGESGFDPAARSREDAVGLMQIRWPQTGRHLGIRREADLYDPCTNVDAGARYLAELLARFDNNLHLALAAYNYGPARISADALPAGASWYSRYIYRHLQQVLGTATVSPSELLAPATGSPDGQLVLMRFHHRQRARDYLAFVKRRLPDLDLRQHDEALGQQFVVLHYQNPRDRERALAAMADAGLGAIVPDSLRTNTLQEDDHEEANSTSL